MSSYYLRIGDSLAQTDAKSSARDALNVYEYSVEALLLLASEEASAEKALAYYEQAAFISEKNFKHEWKTPSGVKGFDNLMVRPYLRALRGLILCFHALGKHDQVKKFCERYFELDALDHFGMHYVLIASFLSQGLVHDALNTLDKYGYDSSIYYTYTNSLLSFMKEGNSPLSNHKLAFSIQCFPYAINNLIDEDTGPIMLNSYLLFFNDSPKRSQNYSQNYYMHWRRHISSLDWASECLRNFVSHGIDQPLKDKFNPKTMQKYPHSQPLKSRNISKYIEMLLPDKIDLIETMTDLQWVFENEENIKTFIQLGGLNALLRFLSLMLQNPENRKIPNLLRLLSTLTTFGQEFDLSEMLPLMYLRNFCNCFTKI